MTQMDFRAGEPCWVDCGTDVAKATAFYRALFGWEIEDLGEEAGGYAMATKGGSQVAGLGPQQNPGPPFWSVYFKTDDAAKTAELVTGAGGTVLVEPFEVMEAGTMAVFTDPVGAAFSVWQPNQMAGFGAVGEPGTYCWAELVTTDVDRSKAFYADVLGLTPHDAQGDLAGYTEWKLDDRSVGGLMAKPDDMPAEIPPFWGVYFAVSDTDATVAKVGELGGMTVAGPIDIPPGRFAACVDPVGAMFSVITPNPDFRP
jgi:predicted enzyme related to lactoylglutathione lyase